MQRALTRVRPTSSTAIWRRHNSSQAEPASLSNLINVLNEEGNKSTDAGQSRIPSHRRNFALQHKSKPFGNNSFLKPNDFTSKARLNDGVQGKRRSPDLVGPRRKECENSDIFLQLGINPIHECQNVSLLSHFVTQMGKIRPRTETLLTIRSQRLLSKAIKRAKAIGMMPRMSKGHLFRPNDGGQWRGRSAGNISSMKMARNY